MENSGHDLRGGFLNAITRGDTLESAKLSFLQAGYPPAVVESVAREFLGEATPSSAPHHSGMVLPSSNLSLYATQDAHTRTPLGVSVGQPRVPYWAIVLGLIVSLGIIIGAGVLGLYWHRLFS